MVIEYEEREEDFWGPLGFQLTRKAGYRFTQRRLWRSAQHFLVVSHTSACATPTRKNTWPEAAGGKSTFAGLLSAAEEALDPNP
jgi:hypothetical protein